MAPTTRDRCEAIRGEDCGEPCAGPASDGCGPEGTPGSKQSSCVVEMGSSDRSGCRRHGREPESSPRRAWMPITALALGSVSAQVVQTVVPVCHGIASCASMLQASVNWTTFFAVFNLAIMLDVSAPGAWIGADHDAQLNTADWAWNNEHVGESMRGLIRYSERRSGDAIVVSFVEVQCLTQYQGERSWVSASRAGSNASVIWAVNTEGQPQAYMCGATADALLGGQMTDGQDAEENAAAEKTWKGVRADLAAQRPKYDDAEKALREWVVYRVVEKAGPISDPSDGPESPRAYAPFAATRDVWMDQELGRLFSDNKTVAVAISNAFGVTNSTTVERASLDVRRGVGANASVLANRDRSSALCRGPVAQGAAAGINLCRGGSLMLDRQDAAGFTLSNGALVRREFIGVAARTGVYPPKYAVFDQAGPRPIFDLEDEPSSSIDELGTMTFHNWEALRTVETPGGVDECAAMFYGRMSPGVPYELTLRHGPPGPTWQEPVIGCDVRSEAVPTRLLQAADKALEANLLGGGDDRPKPALPSQIAAIWLFGSLAAAQMGWWMVCGLHCLQDGLSMLAQEAVRAYAKLQGNESGVPRLRRFEQHVNMYMSFYTDWYLTVRASTLRAYAAALAVLATVLTYGIAGVPVALQQIEQMRHDGWTHRTVFSVSGDSVEGASQGVLLATVERRMTGSTTVWTEAACIFMAVQALGHGLLLYKRIREEQTAQELLVEDVSEGRKTLFEKLRSMV
ncbi:unnamed protein product [Ostreobium quekettii]|uniref:Uncharacterized protein n=1 Tax=Ostreobium quekettii TaxID=121088 RepID=A0A8S1IRZ2_9CHLO|nr:unnamed protein product [Ostreobium quekettii]|eukprot:evm.model.scf_384EXC.1 EVM.evm.TU.scf_384EXC.1   scf_384EXC:23162-25387(+)